MQVRIKKCSGFFILRMASMTACIDMLCGMRH